MSYDEHTTDQMKYRLDKARQKSPAPLKISDSATAVQAFFFSQIKRLNDYLRDDLGDMDMAGSNVGRFFKELLRFCLGRFQHIECDFENGTIKIDEYVDAGHIIAIFEKHAAIFRFMDRVDIQGEQWAVVECDIKDVQVIIFSSSTYTTETIVERLKRAVQFARSQQWDGRLFYTRCDEVVNTEIL